MPYIEIENEQQIEDGWRFVVSINGSNFNVELDKEYWQELTGGHYEAGELVKRSFEFLLVREPKESTLKKFSLREISEYFPEYESEIKKMLVPN